LPEIAGFMTVIRLSPSGEESFGTAFGAVRAYAGESATSAGLTPNNANIFRLSMILYLPFNQFCTASRKRSGPDGFRLLLALARIPPGRSPKLCALYTLSLSCISRTLLRAERPLDLPHSDSAARGGLLGCAY